MRKLMLFQVVPTRVHGIVDYIEGPTLLAAPMLFGLQDVPASALAPRIAGTGSTLYSLVTDYEVAPVRMLPMAGHLALDVMAGSLLAASPWLFGFAKSGRQYWLPHVLVGVGKVGIALMTRTQPSDRPQL
ncbi:MAG: hypothetical protein M3Q29_14305 [Chloroflexota bacterium]|nr:hypothetical protein [Chloroflexota bacterium]